MRLRKTLILTISGLAAATVALTPATGASAAPTGADGYRHATGIQVVPPLPHVTTPAPEAVAQAWSEAYELAMQNPGDFAPPWIDRSGAARLMVDSVTSRGDALGVPASANARALAATGAAAPNSTRRVRHSFAELEAIKQDTIGQSDAQLPGGEAVWQTGIDSERNKVLIVVDKLDERLMATLAARYGTDAIEVSVQARPAATTKSRQDDTSPFYGGSKIQLTSGGSTVGCSTAFPWQLSSTKTAILTAGHCARNGANPVRTTSTLMGQVVDSTRENWSNSGTLKINGDSVYRGDLALIEFIPSAVSAGVNIFRGSSTSSSSSVVKEKWSRRAADGDQYCVGGAVSGEMCGFVVNHTGFSYDYANDGVIRNAVVGIKSSTAASPACQKAGDSGGSVFTVRSDGGIAAKGIYSGGWSIPFSGCEAIFTDIWDVDAALPGTVRIG